MSGSADHDARHAVAQQELAGLALGEPVDPAVSAHVADCAVCEAVLSDYRSIAEHARESDGLDQIGGPSPAVWRRIEAELRPSTGVPRSPRRTVKLRTTLLAAAAVVVVAGAGVAGWAIGQQGSDSGRAATSRAALQAQAGTRDDAHGTALVRATSDGYQLVVQTRRLPAREGFYEVWLYNPSVGRMVAVGTLGTGGRGVFTVPGGIDLGAYHVVDVSAENYDGNPAHARSVLRGPLDR